MLLSVGTACGLPEFPSAARTTLNKVVDGFISSLSEAHFHTWRDKNTLQSSFGSTCDYCRPAAEHVGWGVARGVQHKQPFSEPSALVFRWDMHPKTPGLCTPAPFFCWQLITPLCYGKATELSLPISDYNTHGLLN